MSNPYYRPLQGIDEYFDINQWNGRVNDSYMVDPAITQISNDSINMMQIPSQVMATPSDTAHGMLNPHINPLYPQTTPGSLVGFQQHPNIHLSTLPQAINQPIISMQNMPPQPWLVTTQDQFESYNPIPQITYHNHTQPFSSSSSTPLPSLSTSSSSTSPSIYSPTSGLLVTSSSRVPVDSHRHQLNFNTESQIANSSNNLLGYNSPPVIPTGTFQFSNSFIDSNQLSSEPNTRSKNKSQSKSQNKTQSASARKRSTSKMSYNSSSTFPLSSPPSYSTSTSSSGSSASSSSKSKSSSGEPKETEKADELAATMLREMGSGEEKFELTSAIRYDPGLFYQNYVAENTSVIRNPSLSDKKIKKSSELIEEATELLKHKIFEEHVIPDACFFLLPLHQKRLQYGIDFFDWSADLTLETFVSELHRAALNIFGANKESKQSAATTENEPESGREEGKQDTDAPIADWSKPYKFRALVSSTGSLKIEVSPTIPRANLFSGLKRVQEPHLGDIIYDVVLDTQSTVVSPFTSFKTTKRDVYNRARQTNLRPPLGNSTDPGPSIFADSPVALEEKNKNKFYPLSSPSYQEVLLYNTREEITEGSITSVAFFRDGKWKTPPLGTGCLCGIVRHHLLTKMMIQEGIISKKSLVDGEPVLLFNGVQGVFRGVLRLRNE